MIGRKQKSGTDWAKADAHIIQPEEYEELPELTDEMFDRGSYFIAGQQVSKEEGLAAMAKASRLGRPKAEHPKEVINIRLSPDVLSAFRAAGKGWQTRIDQALREWLKAHPPGGTVE